MATTSRLEAFSDGVLAVIITIMVLELKVPEGTSLQNLAPLLPHLLVYALSFHVIGTYWNNHHHLLKTVKVITPRIMWSNLLLLFCLSLIPFFTAWFGEHPLSTIPNAAYGMSLLAGGLGYFILVRAILASDQEKGEVRRAVGSDIKGKLSLVVYFAGVLLAFVNPWVAIALYVLVAMMWFLPERRLAFATKPSANG